MNGRNIPPWFRILALCTALGLGGTYVWRQQQKALPSEVVPKEVEPVERTVILSSSKSLVIDTAPLQEEKTKTQPPAIRQEPAVDQRVLMPSAKSGIFIPAPQAPDPPKQRTMLPGSKSSSTILELPKTEKP